MAENLFLEDLEDGRVRSVALPEATNLPCNDCPWRRTSVRGWLGPYSAEAWTWMASSEQPIACHQTIREETWANPAVRQCRGAATYRANVGKRPRNPHIACGPVDRERVFATPAQFIEHHNGRSCR